MESVYELKRKRRDGGGQMETWSWRKGCLVPLNEGKKSQQG